MFGNGCCCLIRSSFLYLIGKNKQHKVTPQLKLFTKYYFLTMIPYSTILFVFSYYFSKLFFTDPKMVIYLQNCIKIYSIICSLDICVPIYMTLFRIIDMNSTTIYLSFLAFAFPLNIWLYFAIFKLNLEYLSPIIGLVISNVLLTLCSIFLLMKNFSKKINKMSDVEDVNNMKDVKEELSNHTYSVLFEKNNELT